MTILPKQQAERADEAERDAAEHPRPHGHRARSSPPRWPYQAAGAGGGGRDERQASSRPRASPPPPAAASHWLQAADGAVAAGGPGPGPGLGLTKRRHRASPHRGGRKTHRPSLLHQLHHHRHHHHHPEPRGLPLPAPHPGTAPPGAPGVPGAAAAGAAGGAAACGPGAAAAVAGGGSGGAGGAGGVAVGSPGGAGSEEQGAGYNSEDEYEAAGREQLQDPAKVEQQEHWFEKALSEKKGFVIKRMKEDGACLFRAVADQVYGDQDMHDVVRKHCMDYLVKNADYFSNYVTEDFTTYINRKRISSCHGNHIEMQAMAEMYNRPVEVYQYSAAGPDNLEPINTFHGIHQTEDEPIRVSYHRNIHYNSVVNPNKATIGVGLGLPAFKPGSADQSLMKNAIKTSEESWIEQQMLEDKKRATDWEATNEAIEEQVARESYLQWLRDQEKQARQPRKASATCSSATAAASSGLEEWSGRSPRQRSTASSPEHLEPHLDTGGKPPSPSTAVALALGKPPSPCAPGTSRQMSSGGERVSSPAVSLCPTLDCRAIMQQMSPTAFGLADWEDDEILASVLAVSQQEYLDSMKKSREPHRESSPDHS
ncbi:OTU domain-containing protein 5-A isoform X1 [Mobula birostris]|uniref:OTU domain-containing protein 5-A isoform X1 n=1 Tax=Mobula birostris TaxID=1983395 RepID=UPI003B282ADD